MLLLLLQYHQKVGVNQHSGQTLRMREGITSGRLRATFPPKISKETALSLNERTKIKTHLDICRRKEKSKEKESLRLMEHKAFSSTGFLSIYHFVLSFNRKVKRFLKHRVLLACVVVYNSCETTLFWRPESTPSSHYNVRSCADFDCCVDADIVGLYDSRDQNDHTIRMTVLIMCPR